MGFPSELYSHFQRYCINRYYARLLAPFIPSPVEKQRKEANNEGTNSEQKGFGQRQGSFYWSGCTQRELACHSANGGRRSVKGDELGFSFGSLLSL